MSDKQIPRADLRKLCQCLREIVTLQEKYIALGFTGEEIARTFARAYLRVFEHGLKPEIAAKISTGSVYQIARDNHSAAISYCLALAGEMMKAVSEELKKNRAE